MKVVVIINTVQGISNMNKIKDFLKNLNFAKVAVGLMVVMLVLVWLITLIAQNAADQARQNVLDKATQGQEAIADNLLPIDDPGTSLGLDNDKLVFYLDTRDPDEVEEILQDYADKLGITYKELLAGSTLFYPSNLRAADDARGRSDQYIPPTGGDIEGVLPVWESGYIIRKLEDTFSYTYLVQYENAETRGEAETLLNSYGVDLDQVLFLRSDDERIIDYVGEGTGDAYGNPQ